MNTVLGSCPCTLRIVAHDLSDLVKWVIIILNVEMETETGYSSILSTVTQLIRVNESGFEVMQS